MTEFSRIIPHFPFFNLHKNTQKDLIESSAARCLRCMEIHVVWSAKKDVDSHGKEVFCFIIYFMSLPKNPVLIAFNFERNQSPDERIFKIDFSTLKRLNRFQPK